MYGEDHTIDKAIDKYKSELKSHAWALASVTARLRADLGTVIQGTAPALNLAIPHGPRKVAFDSKLWIQWDEVNAATAKAEALASMIMSVEQLESSFKAILLTRMLQEQRNNTYLFEVSEDSTEAKLEEGGGYYVLGLHVIPGFPLMTAQRLGLQAPSDEEIAAYRTPLYRVIAVSLLSFDRTNRQAVIQLRAAWNGVRNVFDALISSKILSVTNGPIYLLEGPPPNFVDHTRRVLECVGDPPFAAPAKEARIAMGMAASNRRPTGTDKSTPIAEVLWEANRLAEIDIRSDMEAKAIAEYAENANGRPLNLSQKRAVYSCARKRLSLIWGPPGTGKTDTLTALIHSVVHEAQTNSRSKKILVTGPNYRAVEEIMSRLVTNLGKDSRCKCDLFMVYSRSRDPKTLPSVGPYLNAFSLSLDPFNSDCNRFAQSFRDPERVTIVGTTVHQVIKITKFITDNENPIQGLYDFVVIDESSQVEVVRAVQPLAVLKSTSQLVVAGDHLQMPPISQLEPPKNAEYLVGSIQTYLLRRFGLRTNNLLINYRSNRDLVEYAKTIGYPQDLTADTPVKQLKEVFPLQQVISSMPTALPRTRAYVELLEPERAVTTLIYEDAISSQANEVEAKLVAGLAFCIRKSMASALDTGVTTDYQAFNIDDFFQYGIGIVTPHKAQKAMVLKELRHLFPEATAEVLYGAVDTVERFQGSQRQTIIISFAVGDVDIIEGEENFLLQKERTNVAVSRAEAKCIMIMPKSLAYHLPTDQDAAKTARAIKSYVEEYCTNQVPVDITIDAQVYSAEVRWH